MNPLDWSGVERNLTVGEMLDLCYLSDAKNANAVRALAAIRLIISRCSTTLTEAEVMRWSVDEYTVVLDRLLVSIASVHHGDPLKAAHGVQ